jgi:acyl-CoA thioester hydrolase
MGYSYDIEIRAEYVDTDKMGVVHNSNYFRFFERGRCEIMRSLGISYKEIEDRGLVMPLVEQYAKYHSPAYYDDLLILRTTINEIPKAKIRFEYQVFRKEEQKERLLCQGYNVLAFTDEKTLRPKPCPVYLVEKLEKVL